MVTSIQPSFARGELSPFLHGRVDFDGYSTGLAELSNMYVLPQGGAMRRPGFRFLGRTKAQLVSSEDASDDMASHVRLIPFIFSDDDAYVLEFGPNYIRFWRNGKLVTEDEHTTHPLEVVTPYKGLDVLSMGFCQSADVLYLSSRFHAPRKLMRLDSSHTSWELREIDFGPPLEPPSGVIVTKSIEDEMGEGSRYAYRVCALTEAGEMSLASEAFVLATQAISKATEAEYNKITWNAVQYTAPLTGETMDAYEYYVFRAPLSEDQDPQDAYYIYIGCTQGTEFADMGNYNAEKADASQSIPIAVDPFTGTNDYPGLVCLYEQRLWWANTKNRPQTVWGSQTGNYENLNTSYAALDTDGVEFTIASPRVDGVKWLEPLRSLLAGSKSGVWELRGSSADAAIAPSSVSARVQNRRGCAAMPPLALGNTVLFLEDGGRAVREFEYALASDGYLSRDLSVLSAHLTEPGAVTSWCYQSGPRSVVWMVREDGELLGLTYMQEHQVHAWHRHHTDGKVESVCAIPGQGANDVLYAVVARRVGGTVHRFVEALADECAKDDGTDAFYLDSGLSFEGEAATEMDGLFHLEGRTVHILADGMVHRPRVVRDGKVTLDHPAERVHIGLPYASVLQTLPLEGGAPDGTAQGRRRRVHRCVVRLYRTLGCRVGQDRERMESLPFRTQPVSPTARMMGASPGLFTGEKEIMFPGGFETGGQVRVEQERPLPCTVLTVIPSFQVGQI